MAEKNWPESRALFLLLFKTNPVPITPAVAANPSPVYNTHGVSSSCEMPTSSVVPEFVFPSGSEDRKSTRLNSNHSSISFSLFFLMIRRPPRSTLFPYTTALPIYTIPTEFPPHAKCQLLPLFRSLCFLPDLMQIPVLCGGHQKADISLRKHRLH